MELFNRRHPGLIYKLSFLFAFIAAFTFLALRLPQDSQAASLANFRPGNIISDYIMSDYMSMTIPDIDSFLHNHGNCNDTNTAKASWYPSLHYHIEDGHFVCLADERFAASGSNYGDLLGEDEESQTAAEIIYEVSQKYKINPQVFIVLLEKEQGLISDSWPNSIQYRSATGFGCPDTAPCDSEYYGLKNQLESAAWLFRTVLDGGWTNYPLGENFIYYNPNRACGGSIVNIENLATSSLYRYTPYQPNQAALAAGYGTVTCGAYGNRNFYLFFMDWFGDPTITKDQRTPIEQYYASLGGEQSYLGKATNDETCDLDNSGCYQAYEVGKIYWTNKTGAWDVSGRIGDRWELLGGEKSSLGYPISSEGKNLANGGAFQKFENGRIYYTRATGAWEISGKIYDAWYKQGTEWGALGYPTSEEKKDASGATYQQFEHGRIYLREKHTWVIPDWAEKRYEEIGSLTSVLRTPTNDGRCGLVNDGCYQNYEVGRMYYSPNSGAWDISGKIYSRWYELGTEWSSLGYPTSGEQRDANNIVYQQFEHGRIYYKDGKTWVEES